ncbi:hypothetical protein DRJ48_00465 [Candidatus Woesearchaeota archaeon]|nr:MBL fold metallo-hydrolase [Candidatus Woesearchaeota archaeon]RLE43635.1 MAG: hypothetical protein DRJ48_00465 [Candidatus Woesearchaeota archaeon]
MEPRIIFLGTGGDAIVVGKQIRGSGGIVVQTSELQFHIDPGPGALPALKQNKLNIRETSCILVSHPHTNHANDTRAVIQSMTLGGLDKRGVLVCNEASFSGTRGIAPILDEYHKSCLERVIVMNPNQRLGVGDVEVVALPTIHSVPAIGYKIITETFTMAYSADTEYAEKLGNLYKDVDILVLNVVAPFGYRIDNNLSSSDAVKILKKAKPKVAIITHFGIKMINQDPMYQAREIHKKSGVTVIAAEDGLVVNPWAYSIRKRQKRLSSF